MSWIASIISSLVTLLGWFGFGKSKEPDKEGQAIDTANSIGKTSADVARATQTTINKDQADVEARTASDLGSVRAANGVRAKRIAVQDAINRANKDS